MEQNSEEMSNIETVSYKKILPKYEVWPATDTIDYIDLQYDSTVYKAQETDENKFNSLPTIKSGRKARYISAIEAISIPKSEAKEDLSIDVPDTTSPDNDSSKVSDTTTVLIHESPRGIANEAFEDDEDSVDCKKNLSSISENKSNVSYSSSSSSINIPEVDIDAAIRKKMESESYSKPMIKGQLKKKWRGEKLYFAFPRASSENQEQHFWRFCWWMVTLGLLAGAITVAALIGVGVIKLPSRQMNQLNENQIKTRHSHLGPKLSFVGTEEVSEDNFERLIIDAASNVNDVENSIPTTLTPSKTSTPSSTPVPSTRTPAVQEMNSHLSGVFSGNEVEIKTEMPDISKEPISISGKNIVEHKINSITEAIWISTPTTTITTTTIKTTTTSTTTTVTTSTTTTTTSTFSTTSATSEPISSSILKKDLNEDKISKEIEGLGLEVETGSGMADTDYSINDVEPIMGNDEFFVDNFKAEDDLLQSLDLAVEYDTTELPEISDETSGDVELVITLPKIENLGSDGGVFQITRPRPDTFETGEEVFKALIDFLIPNNKKEKEIVNDDNLSFKQIFDFIGA